MVQISKYQLFTLMFIFEVGSTTLFALGIGAKQDAWIVILIALLIGLVLVYILTELQKAFPEKNLAEIIISILGIRIGAPLALLYAAGALWSNARILREFGELIIITSLPETPLIVINFIFTLLSLYVMLKGIEVLARVSEILMPVILIFIISVYVLVSLSGLIDFHKLTPVLGEGIYPILKELPNVSMFPFGEIFIFTMYWRYANIKKDVRKTAMYAVSFSGILLCFSLITDIVVLGDKYTSIATIPLMEAIRVINIGGIITNVDAIATMMIFFGGFFKMSIYTNGIVLILVTVFKIKHYKLTLILYSFFLLCTSIIFEPDYAYHRWMTPFDTNYFGIVFTHIIPTLLLFIYYIKKKRTEL